VSPAMIFISWTIELVAQTMKMK